MIDPMMVLGQKPLPNAPTKGRIVRPDGGPAEVLPEKIRPGTVAADVWPYIPAAGDGICAREASEKSEREYQSVCMSLARLVSLELVVQTSDSPKRYRRAAADDGQDAGDDEPLPPADPVLLASANRMLGDRLAGVAHVLRGCGLPALANIDDGEDLQPYVATLSDAYQSAVARVSAHEEAARQWEQMMMDAVGEDGLGSVVTAIERMKAQIAGLQRELGQERTSRAALEEQVQALHAQLDSRQSSIYLVRAPKAAPRLTFKRERAVACAKSAARKGGRAEVFALVPIGKAVPGAEWMEVSA